MILFFMIENTQLLNKKLQINCKPYRIVTLIGEGSHARVWLVRAHLYPNDELIIKIAKDQNGIAAERVQNEIWFLKEIAHANIPPLVDHGCFGGYLWLAMPVYRSLMISLSVRGRLRQFDLSDIRPHGYPKYARKIPFRHRQNKTIGVLAAIGDAISYLAGTGIVHGDISPGNIMEHKGSLINKSYLLTDWGASALIHQYPETAFGSLHFLAPERLLGTISNKSDLFSLGVTCFYILTGMVPYTGENGELYYLNILERDGIAPSAIVADIGAALDKIVRDLIRKRPEDRPSPQELCKRMTKIKAGVYL